MWNREWTQLAGYRITGLTVDPGQIVFQLQEPEGKTPVRIRLLEPTSNNLPPSPAVSGVAIAAVVMREGVGGDEAISVELVDGRLLRATCHQIAVDVF